MRRGSGALPEEGVFVCGCLRESGLRAGEELALKGVFSPFFRRFRFIRHLRLFRSFRRRLREYRPVRSRHLRAFRRFRELRRRRCSFCHAAQVCSQRIDKHRHSSKSHIHSTGKSGPFRAFLEGPLYLFNSFRLSSPGAGRSSRHRSRPCLR